MFYVIYDFKNKKIVAHFNDLNEAKKFVKNSGWTNKNILKFTDVLKLN